jgi:hypothetical protein
VPVKSDSDDSDSQNDSTSTWQPLVSGGARGDNLSYKLVENERFKFSSVLRPYVLVDELDPEFKKDEPRLFDGYQHLTRGIALPGSAVLSRQSTVLHSGCAVRTCCLSIWKNFWKMGIFGGLCGVNRSKEKTAGHTSGHKRQAASFHIRGVAGCAARQRSYRPSARH